MVIVDKICPQCDIKYIDLDRDDLDICFVCNNELEVFFGSYNLGTGKKYRPSLARKLMDKPAKLDKNGKPIS